MVYQGLVQIDVDRDNQDPYNEPRTKTIGPYDTTGDGTETALVALRKGSDLSSILAANEGSTAITLKIYGCNDPTLGADPLTDNYLFLLDTFAAIAAGATDWGEFDSSFKWLIISETDAFAGGQADAVVLAIHMSHRAGV